ncbi:MAG: AgmX/PglI C-terminal domain-containing protein [Proteobacteria bacterium]|nr:AgmX/PglI C-terminal domain-containing protein [Pseudomonadota bacterium]
MAAQANKEKKKVLRIGVIQGGKLVQQRLIPSGESVTIGESAKATFVFPKTGLPRAEYPLFVHRKGDYVLNFTEGMKGKISSGGVAVTLAKLRSDPGVAHQGGSWRLGLTNQDRGKVAVGDVTVLFQFVPPPPVQAVQPLKAMDFRPRLLEDDDPVFLGFLGVWCALALILLVFVYVSDPPEYTLEEMPDRFTKIVLQPEAPEVEPEEAEETEEVDENAEAAEAEEAEPEEVEPEEPKEPKSVEEVAADQQQQIEELKEKSLLLKMLTTRSEHGVGTAEDAFAEGDAGIGDLDAALEGVGGVEMATGENGGIRGGTGTTEDADIGVVGRAGGGSSDLGDGPSTTIKGSVASGTVDAGDLEDGDLIRRTISKNQGALTYCYEQRLRQNPSLSGRVEVEWAIRQGRPTGISVFANSTGDDAFGECIVGKIARWRFDGVDTDGDLVSAPFVFSPKN